MVYVDRRKVRLFLRPARPSLCFASTVCHPPGCASANRPSSVVQLREGGVSVATSCRMPPPLTRGANDAQMANAMEGFPIHPEKKAVMHSLSVLASTCLHTCSCMSGSFDLESFGSFDPFIL